MPAPNANHADASDEELVRLYLAGRDEVFETLLRRHHDELLRFLTRLTGNRALAEDAFQETFLQIHISAPTFDTGRRFKPWLFTIAANKARDAMRRSARRKALDLSAPLPGAKDSGPTFVDLLQIDTPAPDEALSSADTARRVQQAMDDLPYPLREIILLAYFQRLSYNQIADSLEIPLGTVKSRLHSAVAAFGRKWSELSSRSPQEPSSD